MILQRMQIPSADELQERFFWNKETEGAEKAEIITETSKLYWRAKGEVSFIGESQNTGICMKRNAVVSFNTYFNSFSCGKWKEYTTVETAHFQIMGKGKFRVDLYHEYLKDGTSGRKKVCSFVTQGGEKSEAVRLYTDGSLYAVVSALEPSVLSGGLWETSKKIERTPRISIVMCTYKKEKYVKRNLEILKRMAGSGEEPGEIPGGICIVDNGKTLSISEFPEVTIIPNRNTGGSGGFTRGIQAVLDGELKDRQDTESTHMLLMDDDVVIEAEAINRVYAFLSYQKQEYDSRLLGGAMLRLDYPYIQHEAGGVWNHGRIHSIHQGFDLRRMQNVLHNEIYEKERADYAAWWFCCIPVSYAKKYGLPMPFFLHCDDIEYSLRGGSEPIYMNGIAVWHEQFENKRYSATEYYDVRNMLFTNSLHCPEYRWKDAAFSILYKVYANLIRYRYKDVELVIRAVEDYMKGEKWLRSVDEEKLHEEIVGKGYRLDKIEGYERAGESRYSEDTAKLYEYKSISIKKKISLYIVTCLHIFERKKNVYYLSLGAPVYHYLFKKRVMLFDPDNGKGFIVEKNNIKNMHYMVEAIKIIFKLLLQE